MSESGNDSYDDESNSDSHSDLVPEIGFNENRQGPSSETNLQGETFRTSKKKYKNFNKRSFCRKPKKGTDKNNNNSSTDENEESAQTSHSKTPKKRKHENVRKILPSQMSKKENDNNLSSDENFSDFACHPPKKITRKKLSHKRQKFIKIPWSDRFDFMEKYFSKYIFTE